MVTNTLVADKPMLLRNRQKSLFLQFFQTESHLVFVHDRLCPVDAADLVLFWSQDRVVIWEELIEGLVQRGHSVVINVKHLIWDHLFIQSEFHWGVRRVFGLVLGVLDHRVVAEEFNPSLEVWHHSVSWSPLFHTVRGLFVVWCSLGVVDFVMQNKKDLISSWIVHGGNIWILEHRLL